MGEFDRVDRLMKEAAQPPSRQTPQPESDAEAVLEAQVSAAERNVPQQGRTSGRGAREAGVPAPRADAVPEPSSAPGGSQTSAAERGRQILGALRPFLPVVGGALRMVDHGAAQAVARMLPALGVMGAVRGTEPQPAPAGQAAATATFEKQQAELRHDLHACQVDIAAHDERFRRLRESLERAVAEQGTLSHQANQAAERTRLLTAGLVVLLMMVTAELVMLIIVFRR